MKDLSSKFLRFLRRSGFDILIVLGAFLVAVGLWLITPSIGLLWVGGFLLFCGFLGVKP